MRRAAVLLLALPLACQPADTSAAAKLAIDANNARWAQLTSAGHADSIADFYHADGVLYPPNMPDVRGRDSIRAFFAVLNTMSSPPPTLVVRAESVWAAGPAAVELGRWTFTWPAGARRPPGAPAVDSGRYVVRWVQENGRWVMLQDIWNSGLGMPTP
jgi:ketosteroid isomerase-like protein